MTIRYLGLVFKNIESGRRIFSGWRHYLGGTDVFDEIYISIIEGPIRGETPGYSVHISSDPPAVEARLRSEGMDAQFNHAIVISRYQRMNPEPGSPHLSMFKRDCREAGRFGLVAVSAGLEPQCDCAIEKRRIWFRGSAEITATGRDVVVFPEGCFETVPVR